MTLNRQIPPEIYPIQTIFVPEVSRFNLSNGLPVYYLNAGTQDVLKIEFLFKAGLRTEKQKGVASVTCSMIFEGTHQLTAKEIHEELDQLGVFFETNTGTDFSSICFFSLRKHLKTLLPLICEIISNVAFPENELRLLLRKRKEMLKVSRKKNEYLARKLFLSTLLGKEHPYTQDLSETDYHSISRSTVVTFFQKNLLPENGIILISGKTHADDLKMIDEFFGKKQVIESTDVSPYHFSPVVLPKKRNVLIKPKTIQASIRTGKILFTINHPDYAGFNVLNEILGGYFGSRLMSNIREEKGYTYGIGSVLFVTRDFGIFEIATDAKGEMADKVTEEIYKEIDILRNKLVTSEELNRVKNYMLGAFLASLSSPFSRMDKFLTLYKSGLDYSFYKHYIEVLRNISPEEIRELAIKYLDPATMTEVIVGPGN